MWQINKNQLQSQPLSTLESKEIVEDGVSPWVTIDPHRHLQECYAGITEGESLILGARFPDSDKVYPYRHLPSPVGIERFSELLNSRALGECQVFLKNCSSNPALLDSEPLFGFKKNVKPGDACHDRSYFLYLITIDIESGRLGKIDSKGRFVPATISMLESKRIVLEHALTDFPWVSAVMPSGHGLYLQILLKVPFNVSNQLDRKWVMLVRKALVRILKVDLPIDIGASTALAQFFKVPGSNAYPDATIPEWLDLDGSGELKRFDFEEIAAALGIDRPSERKKSSSGYTARDYTPDPHKQQRSVNTGAALAMKRDLLELARIREWEIPEGQRHYFLLALGGRTGHLTWKQALAQGKSDKAATAEAYKAMEDIFREVNALFPQHLQLSEGEIDKEVRGIKFKSRLMAKKITIAQWLEITPEEGELIAQNAERDNERRGKPSKFAPLLSAATLEAYEDAKLKKKADRKKKEAYRAALIQSDRYSAKQIAEMAGCSLSTVYREMEKFSLSSV